MVSLPLLLLLLYSLSHDWNPTFKNPTCKNPTCKKEPEIRHTIHTIPPPLIWTAEGLTEGRKISPVVKERSLRLWREDFSSFERKISPVFIAELFNKQTLFTLKWSVSEEKLIIEFIDLEFRAELWLVSFLTENVASVFVMCTELFWF